MKQDCCNIAKQASKGPLSIAFRLLHLDYNCFMVDLNKCRKEPLPLMCNIKFSSFSTVFWQCSASLASCDRRGINLSEFLVPKRAQVNRLVAMQHFYKFLFSMKLSSDSLYLGLTQHHLLQANETQACKCLLIFQMNVLHFYMA